MLKTIARRAAVMAAALVIGLPLWATAAFAATPPPPFETYMAQKTYNGDTYAADVLSGGGVGRPLSQ